MSRKLTDEEILALDWGLFDDEIAATLKDREFPGHPYAKGVSKSTIWKWRHQFGKQFEVVRRPNRKDRTTWDWSLTCGALAKLHGVSRQRVHQIKTALNGTKPHATAPSDPSPGGRVEAPQATGTTEGACAEATEPVYAGELT